MIFEILPHDDGCVGSYNFFVSQRPALILSGNQIQTYSNRIITRNLHEQFWTTEKIKSKGRKFTHRTSPIRGANPPADAITLRCNHFTSHEKGRSRAASGPRQGAKIFTEVFGNRLSNKNFQFSGFSGHAVFTLTNPNLGPP